MEPFRIIFVIILSALSSGAIYSTATPGALIFPTRPNREIHFEPLVTSEPLSETINITPKAKHQITLPVEEEVTTLEQFYRVYEDGTIEFKIVLSNGLAQFQKITNKLVDGKTIQVYEGYNSERFPDGTYRTTVYIADEKGYRRSRREFDTKPPVLPIYVPHVPKVDIRVEKV